MLEICQKLFWYLLWENSSLRMYDLTPVHKASAIKDWKDYSITWNDERFLMGSKIFVCLSCSRKGLAGGVWSMGSKINISQTNNTMHVPTWKPGAKICFSYKKPTCNTDLCNTQQWGLNLGRVDVTWTSLLFWGEGVERVRQILLLILLLHYAYNTMLGTLGFSA